MGPSSRRGEGHPGRAGRSRGRGAPLGTGSRGGEGGGSAGAVLRGGAVVRLLPSGLRRTGRRTAGRIARQVGVTLIRFLASWGPPPPPLHQPAGHVAVPELVV